LTGHTDIPREGDIDFLAPGGLRVRCTATGERSREEAEAHSHQSGEAFREEDHTTQEENRTP
jgi:hypothetical protein